MPNKQVVVTGLGALTPIGLGIEAYWKGLKAGISGAAPITYFDTSEFKTRFACELKGYDPKDYLDRREQRRMDAFTHYGLIATDEAIRDACLDFEKLDRTRIGVVVGSGIGGIQTFEEQIGEYHHRQKEGGPKFNPFFIPKMIIDLMPGHISMRYGLQGPNYSAVSACATATNNIIDGWMLIQQDLADVVIVGGAEAAITEGGIGGFNAMKALSERNDSPETASRPFDADRDGFVLGEGAGILVLESREHADKRNTSKIYCELAGIGLTADAHHMTAPDPEGKGVRMVLEQVMRTAGVQPEEVDHINTHGTSTPLGDIAETKAIKLVMGEHAKNIQINSTKSMTGHLLGAAGGIEAIASILAMQHNIVPPTINHFTDDPECDLNYTFNTAVEREVNVAISNTFGFGGHNASLLFKKVKG
ncbi:MAG: beta-ketoacyl-ACP synthase II [Bacteroidota bacterium]